MTLLHDAYTAWLSGITTKTGNEIHWQDEKGYPITIEPVDVSKGKYIVRHYYSNGNKYLEEEYQNEKLHGKCFGWYISRNKSWEQEYQNGQPHGKSIDWYESGNKYREDEYQNGRLYGKSIGWDDGGNKLWESEYRNGIKIK